MPAEVLGLIVLSLVLLGAGLLGLVLMYRVERRAWRPARGEGGRDAQTDRADTAARAADRAPAAAGAVR